MNIPPKLSFSCPLPWTTMTGTERWKYCAQCGHHVTNLSLLSAAERNALLERAKMERICGSYYVRLSGEMVTPEAPLTSHERQGIKQMGVAVLSAAAMAIASGCVSTAAAPKNSPVTPPAQPAVVETAKPVTPPARVNPSPSPDQPEDTIVLQALGMMECYPVAPITATRKPGRSGK